MRLRLRLPAAAGDCEVGVDALDFTGGGLHDLVHGEGDGDCKAVSGWAAAKARGVGAALHTEVRVYTRMHTEVRVYTHAHTHLQNHWTLRLCS